MHCIKNKMSNFIIARAVIRKNNNKKKKKMRERGELLVESIRAISCGAQYERSEYCRPSRSVATRLKTVQTSSR